MFHSEHHYNEKKEEIFGLSVYIRTMENESYYTRAHFPDWDEQYKMLKRLRWLRSQIAHNVEVSECSESDLEDLKRFYNQIMTQNDILANAYRWKKQQTECKKTSTKAIQNEGTRQITNQINTNYIPENNDKGKSVWLWILGITAVIFIIAVIIRSNL